MFIFLLQIRHMFEGHQELYLFAFYSALIWLLWLLKVIISSRYRPYVPDYEVTTSVVVPVVDEPLDLFRDVIGRMVEQRPGEIIVVINGAPNPGLVEVCEEFAPLVRWTHTPIPGKRNAVMIGTKMSTGDITVLVDSDTVWTPNTLSELVKPFADERVGGVTTQAAHPRTDAQLDHTLGGLARELARAVFDARPECASARSAAFPAARSPSVARS